MKLMEKQVASEEIFRGKVLHVVRDTVELPNGRLATREVVHHPGAVCIVPLTEDEEVIMERQFRYPFHRVMLEIPAGKLEPGEDPLLAAKRELSEETGVIAQTLEPLGDFYGSVAIFDEKIHTYLARGLTFSTAHMDEDEFLNVERIPLQTLKDMVLAGEICDGKTQAAILKTWLRLHG